MKEMLGRLLERVAQERNAQYMRRATSSNTHPPKTAVMQAFDYSVSVKKNEGHTRGVSWPLAKATRHSSLS